jgi:hypothetical protein
LKESESTTNSSHGIRKIVDETVHVLGEALDSMRRMSGSTNAGSKEKISMLQVQNLSDRVLKLQGNLEGSAHKSERSP